MMSQDFESAFLNLKVEHTGHNYGGSNFYGATFNGMYIDPLSFRHQLTNVKFKIKRTSKENAC